MKKNKHQQQKGRHFCRYRPQNNIQVERGAQVLDRHAEGKTQSSWTHWTAVNKIKLNL